MTAVTATEGAAAPVFLSANDLAQRWGMAPGSLANARHQGRGPAFVKLGSAVRYALADVEAYEAANRRACGGAR